MVRKSWESDFNRKASDRGGGLIASSKRMGLQVTILAAGAYFVVLDEITAGTTLRLRLSWKALRLLNGSQWRIVSSARQAFQRLNYLIVAGR